MAESLIDRQWRWAARPTHFVYLGDQAKAAEWKSFALKRKYQLLNIGNGGALVDHLYPDANTKISIYTLPGADRIVIEVSGGLPHGIVSIPCTSLSPLGFGVPLLGSGDEWGSSGVDNPEAYDPPVTHPANGRAYQLAFLTTDGKGQVVPETKIPEVKHGSAWAGIVGKQKISDAGEKSDLRYGGPEGVAVYLDAQKKKKNVFSLNNKRMVWGIYPVPGMAKLYMNGQAANAYIQLGENEYLLSNAVSLGLRGNTLILLCYIQDGYGIFTAEAPKKIKDKVVFVQCGDAIHLTGMLTAQPNFLFNKSGTRCSAVIPFPTTPTETDTKVVHIDLDDSFAPTLTIVPPSAAEVTFSKTLVATVRGGIDNLRGFVFWIGDHYDWTTYLEYADITYVDGDADSYGCDGEYKKIDISKTKRPVACGYDGDTFILAEFEEIVDLSRNLVWSGSSMVTYETYDLPPYPCVYIDRPQERGTQTVRAEEYHSTQTLQDLGGVTTRTYYINGVKKAEAVNDNRVFGLRDYRVVKGDLKEVWGPDQCGIWYLQYYFYDEYQVIEYLGNYGEAGYFTPEAYIKAWSWKNIYPYGYDLKNMDIYTVHIGMVLTDWYYDNPENLGTPLFENSRYDVSFYRNDTKLHTIASVTKPVTY